MTFLSSGLTRLRLYSARTSRGASRSILFSASKTRPMASSIEAAGISIICRRVSPAHSPQPMRACTASKYFERQCRGQPARMMRRASVSGSSSRRA